MRQEDFLDQDLVDNEELEDAQEEGGISEEEVEEEKPLTKSKILALVGIGTFLFFMFFVLLFPLDEVIKSYLISFSKKSGVIIEFKDIHFPLLGAKTIDSLAIQPSNDMVIKAEELLLDTKTLELIKYRFDGEIGITGFKYDSGDISFLIKSILIAGKLSGLDDRITRYSGDINLTFRGGEISSLPDIPLIGEVKKIDILQGQLKLKFRSGRIQVDLGNVNTSWFKIQITGQIRLNDNIGFSNLDLKLCAQAQEKFAQERPDVAGLLALAPQENGRACLPIQGTFRSPKLDMPSLMGGGMNDTGTPDPPGNLNADSSSNATGKESGNQVKDEESTDTSEY